MRFPDKTSRESFLENVKEFCLNETQSLRTAALVNPKRYADWEGTWRLPRDLDQLFFLAVWSWYVDEEIGCLLRLQIDEVARQNEDLFALRFLTQSRTLFERYLIETNLWHTREFFGNVLCAKMVKIVSNKIKVHWKSKRKPTKAVRRRGYKDKGSLRSDVSPNKFIDMTREMNELERHREVLDETELFLQGFLE